MNISDLAEDYLIDRKEGMRKLTASLLNEVMQLEAEKQIQARPYERTGKRRAHRNGTRPRSLKTIHGEIELDKPQFRGFPFKICWPSPEAHRGLDRFGGFEAYCVCLGVRISKTNWSDRSYLNTALANDEVSSS